ncbi:MAG: addiction module antidote protein [Rickettsiales bacterium]
MARLFAKEEGITVYRDYNEILIEKLKDKEQAQAYLKIALEEYIEDHDKAIFFQALRAVAEAHGGLSKLSGKAKLNRQNLYKALSSKGNPKFETVGSILKCLGFKISIELDRRKNYGAH